MCLSQGNCQILRRRCDWVMIPRGGQMVRPRGGVSNRGLSFPVSHAFPFLHRDSQMIPGLKAGGSGCAAAAGFTPLTPDSWSTPNPFIPPTGGDNPPSLPSKDDDDKGDEGGYGEGGNYGEGGDDNL